MANTHQPDDAVLGLIFKLASVNAGLIKATDATLVAHTGLSFVEFKLLMSIVRNHETSQKDAADLLGLTPGAVSRQFEAMQDKGLLKREVRPDNRRQHILTLTPSGIDKAEAGKRCLSELYQPLRERLSQPQITEVSEALQIIQDTL